MIFLGRAWVLLLKERPKRFLFSVNKIITGIPCFRNSHKFVLLESKLSRYYHTLLSIFKCPFHFSSHPKKEKKKKRVISSVLRLFLFFSSNYEITRETCYYFVVSDGLRSDNTSHYISLRMDAHFFLSIIVQQWGHTHTYKLTDDDIFYLFIYNNWSVQNKTTSIQ